MRKLRIMASLIVDINIEEEVNEKLKRSEELEVSTSSQKLHHNLSTLSLDDQDEYYEDDGDFSNYSCLLLFEKDFYELTTHQFLHGFFSGTNIGEGEEFVEASDGKQVCHNFFHQFNLFSKCTYFDAV